MRLPIRVRRGSRAALDGAMREQGGVLLSTKDLFLIGSIDHIMYGKIVKARCKAESIYVPLLFAKQHVTLRKATEVKQHSVRQ